MNQPLKVLFAYDGSEGAHAALSDLRRAGLPDEAQALVMSSAELWLPTPRSFGGVETQFSESSPTAIEQAEAQAQEAREYLQTAFPRWAVASETALGSPARKLLEKADEWRPDLIVVGSHGRTGLAKVLLGSVSQKVLHEAGCSVRVARGRARPPAAPVSIIIGVDGSPGATAAVQAVAARHWPPGSEVRLVCAELPAPLTTGSQVTSPIVQWLHEERARMRHAVQDAATLFREIGLTVTTVSQEGEPKELLCAEAENWGADCIFVGAKKLGRVDRFLLGSVSSAVAARAPCSVEVVRQQ